MNRFLRALSVVLGFLNKIRLMLLPYWKGLWHFSFFNRTRFKSIGFFKKFLSLGYTFILSLLLFLLAMEINFLWIFGHMPSMKEVRNPKIALITEVYTADKKLMGTFFVEQRKPVTFKQIHPKTVEALIATEDIRFYQHHGLDFYALSSAVFSTFQGNKRGGSTITQQLVKNVYRTRTFSAKGLLGYVPLVRTIIAKLKEWITALKIEFYYSKEDILTMYFNVVDFGNNSFGIKTASEYYFSKSPEKLKVEESAVLVGLLKAPSYYNPKNNLERARDRRNVVLSQMHKYGFIDSLSEVKLSSKKLRLKIKEIVQEQGIAPYFRAALVKELKDWCEENDYNVYTDGLKIYTTIDSRIQKHAETAVEENLAELQQAFENSFWGHSNWFDYKIALEKRDLLQARPELRKLKDKSQMPLTGTERMVKSLVEISSKYKSLLAQGFSKDSAWKEMEKKTDITVYWRGKTKETRMSAIDSIKYYNQLLKCGLVSIEPQTGHIKAWVGGNNWDYFKYDHVNQARRQAGSTFKPMLYAAAYEEGLGPCDEIVDKPVSIPVIDKGEEVMWEPKNADHRCTFKPMTLRTAVGRSINTVAAQLTQQIGPDKVVKMAQKLGIKSKLEPAMSIALGTNDVHLLELTNAYSAFVNEGKTVKPLFVTEIKDHKGNGIVKFKVEEKRVMTEENAYLMTFSLRGGIEERDGTSRALYRYGICYDNEIGGKTGTSENNADGWYVGITHNLITGVWVGCDDMRIHMQGQSGQGGRTALPVFGRFMQLLYEDPATGIKKGKFPKPSRLEKSTECQTIYIAQDTVVVDSFEDQWMNDSILRMIEEGALELPEEDLPVETPVGVEE